MPTWYPGRRPPGPPSGARVSWVRLAVGLAAAGLSLGLPAVAGAVARVDIELVTETGFPATAQQQWYLLLTGLKVDNLRIRAARADDEPRIEVLGAQTDPVYKVTGILTGRSELLLPGGTFSPRDRKRLAAWLTRLREEGPERAKGARPLPFGLSPEQLDAVHEDLSRAVDFSTQGLDLHEVLDRVGQGLDFPLALDQSAAQALAEAAPVADEVRGMSSGSAAAYLLRSEGLVLRPRLGARRRPEYALTASREDEAAWPVGWPLEAPEPEVLPEMFELLKVQIDDVALAEALEAIGERLATPMLFDRHALVREDIDITKVKVSLPPRTSAYASVLRKILFQAKLKHELRVDEAGRPLLWITTLRPGP